MLINHILNTPENEGIYPGIKTYKEVWSLTRNFKDFENGQIIAVITWNDRFVWLNNDAEKLFKNDMNTLKRKEKLKKINENRR